MPDEILATELGELVNDELEALVTALQEEDAVDELDEADTAEIEQATAQLAGFSDALEIVRAAQHRAKGCGKGGKGKGGGKSKGPRPLARRTEALAMAAQPRAKGTGGSRLQESIAARMAKSSCRLCSQPGHWAGGPECRGPPRSANIVDEGVTQTEALIADGIIPKDMEALPLLPGPPRVLSSTRTAARASWTPPAHARPPAASGSKTTYKRLLRLSDLETEIRPVAVNETFRFGDGRRVPCDTAYEIPVVIANTPMKVEACVIPNSPLSLLLGRDFYKTYTPDILLKSRLRIAPA